MLLLVLEISLNPLSLDLGSLEVDDKRNDGFETTLLGGFGLSPRLLALCAWGSGRPGLASSVET